LPLSLRICRFLILPLLLSGCISTGQPQPEKTSADLTNLGSLFAQGQAESLFRQGKTEQGIAFYKKIIAEARAQKSPFTAELWLGFADQLAGAGRADEARRELVALLNWADDENLPLAEGQAAERLARLEHHLGNKRASHEWRETALAAFEAGGFDKHAIDTRIALALSLRSENPRAASEILEVARRQAVKAPQFSGKRLNIDLALTEIALGQNKLSEAEAHLDRAAEELGAETPENGTGWADIHVRRARLAIIRKDEARADDAALKAILAVDRSRLPPARKSGALIATAKHLWALGYREASRDIAARAAEIAMASAFKNGVTEKEINSSPLAVQAADYQVKYAKFEKLLGNDEAASKAFARVLEIVPENDTLDDGRRFIKLQTSTPFRLEALLGLAKIHIEKGDLDKARTLAEQALKLSKDKHNEPGRLDAEVTLAEATRDSKAFQAALDRQMKSKGKQKPETAVKTLLRYARFHAASDDIKEKEGGLGIALVALIAMKSDTQRLEAAKLVLDIADDITENGPPELKLKAKGLAEAREFYETRKSEILKRATRLSPVPWS